MKGEGEINYSIIWEICKNRYSSILCLAIDVLRQSLILDDLVLELLKVMYLDILNLGEGCFIDRIKNRISCNSNKYIKGNNFSSISLDL